MGATPPAAAKLDDLLGVSRAVSTVLGRILEVLDASLLFFLLFFLFRLILRKEWLAGVGFVVFFVALRGISSPYPLADIPAMIIVYGAIIFMLLRCGLLSLVVAIFGSEQESDEVPNWRGFRDFALFEEFDSSSVRSADAGFAEGIAETGKDTDFQRSGVRLRISWNTLNSERLRPVRAHRKKHRAMAASAL